jgi:hypothetical protein
MTPPRIEPSKQPTAIKFSKRRLAMAFAIAGISDAIGAFATPLPPIVWVVDLVTALLLFLVAGPAMATVAGTGSGGDRPLGCFHSGCWWLERLLSWALLALRLNGADELVSAAEPCFT